MDIICYSCGRGENPENTIEGIEHCQQMNNNWRIEMDIQITSDDRLILFHDQNTIRTTGENKLINELSLDQVKKLNAGYNFKLDGEFPFRIAPIRIPELSEVFSNYPRAKLLLDIHSDDLKAVEIIISLIESQFYNGDFIIASEYDLTIKKLKELRPNWTYGAPEKEAKKMLYSSFIRLDNLFPIKSDILMLPKTYGEINVLSKRVMYHAKKRNIPVWAWMHEGETVKTVETKEEMAQLNTLGVDAIFTEYPKKIKMELGLVD